MSNKFDDQTAHTLDKKTFDIHVHSCELLIRRPLLTDVLYRRHTQLLSSGKAAIYDFYRNDCKWLTIPTSIKTFFSNDLFSTTALPAKVFVVFFEEDRLNGDFSKSIQVYKKPKNLVYCGLELDNRPIQDFATHQNGTYDTGLDNFQFLNIFLTTQTYYNNRENVPAISKEDFNSKSFILCYDLTTSAFISEGTFPLLKTGSLKLRLEFSAATSKTYNCLVFSTSPATMCIDSNRNVTMSYRV